MNTGALFALLKAAKTTPGQLSLFDESAHSRDESGRFSSGGGTAHHKSRVDQMGLEELQSFDAEIELDEDEGDYTLGEIAEVHEHHQSRLAEMEGKFSTLVENTSNQFSKLADEAIASEPETYDDLEDMKNAVTSAYRTALKTGIAGSRELGADASSVDEIMSRLHSEYMDTLDWIDETYSSNEEDWD